MITKEQFRKVEAWLYRVKSDVIWRDKLNLILPEMRLEIKELGVPSISAVDYDKVSVMGGERTSVQEQWVLNEKIEKRVARFRKLLLEKVEVNQKILLFEKIMGELKTKDAIYEKVYTIKYGRFYPSDKVPTNEEIANELGCTRMTFFRLRKKMVETFAEYV